MTQEPETSEPVPSSSTTVEASRINGLRQLVRGRRSSSPLNGNWRRRAKRRNKKPFHDMSTCKETTRTAWHEAGHALIALMNHPESVRSLEHYGGKSFNSALGVCRFEDIAPDGHFDDYMPPECDLAGVVAECILTRENFYDVWWSHSIEGQTDFSHFKEKCEMWDIDVHTQMDEMVERTFALLVAHRGVLRKVAKKLMRCKCLSSYPGSWLYRIGLTLTPMPNPKLFEALERRQQWIQQWFADEKALNEYYKNRSNRGNTNRQP